MKIFIATILAALPLVVVGSTGHAADTDAGRWGIKPSPRSWIVQPNPKGFAVQPDPKGWSKHARPDPRGSGRVLDTERVHRGRSNPGSARANPKGYIARTPGQMLGRNLVNGPIGER
jgi:hypothetical protein